MFVGQNDMCNARGMVDFKRVLVQNRPFPALVTQYTISTLVTGKFENIRIPTSIVSLPCSAKEEYHVC